jgi:hypothetical protein
MTVAVYNIARRAATGRVAPGMLAAGGITVESNASV